MREPNPIQRVELSEKNKTLRIIAAIALFVIGVVGITVGIKSALSKDTGWQRVQITTQERNCSEQFVLQYNFGGTGAQATAVNQKLQSVYGEACVKAYGLFTIDEEIAGVNNMYYVNRHPNETVTVDPVLYAAFEKLQDTPWLYLGPVYSHYSNMIFNTDETLLDQLDPALSAEAKAYVTKLSDFAADRNAVELKLLGDNQVMLAVSQEYLTFAKAEEIETFIDFSYLTNAFIIDYLADSLVEAGLTDCYLVSSDGFTRNLASGQKFRFNIFDRIDNIVYPAAVMEYQGPISMVYLKDYPNANSDMNYRGRMDYFIHLMADPADGMYRTAEENLVSYSYELGCVDVLLQMLPGFVGSEFRLPQELFSIWCEDDLVCYNDEAIRILDPLQSEDMSYRIVLKK